MAVRNLCLLVLLVFLATCRDDPTGTEEPPGNNEPRITLTIAPDSGVILPGDTVQFGITLTDASGGSVASTGLAWLSTDTTIAAVTQTGRVVGKRAGATRIVAVSNAVTD